MSVCCVVLIHCCLGAPRRQTVVVVVAAVLDPLCPPPGTSPLRASLWTSLSWLTKAVSSPAAACCPWPRHCPTSASRTLSTEQVPYTPAHACPREPRAAAVASRASSAHTAHSPPSPSKHRPAPGERRWPASPTAPASPAPPRSTPGRRHDPASLGHRVCCRVFVFW